MNAPKVLLEFDLYGARCAILEGGGFMMNGFVTRWSGQPADVALAVYDAMQSRLAAAEAERDEARNLEDVQRRVSWQPLPSAPALAERVIADAGKGENDGE